ncbi:MAG: HAD-IA family hydrolase [Opitutales bacterium]|nr:HAD-IA family hydrolase [Opitutales bacterium]
MATLRAILFDFDGLILDTETACYGGWKWVFENHGLKYPLEDFQRIVGTDKSPRPLLEARLGSSVDWDSVDAGRREYERELGQDMEIKPGVFELLKSARSKGWRRAVVSSSPRHWVHPHLERRGVSELFEDFICHGDAPRAKPAPDLYFEALRRLELSGAETVALEDSYNGSMAAKQAGIWCVAVPSDITRTMDFSHVDLITEDLEQLTLERLIEEFRTKD